MSNSFSQTFKRLGRFAQRFVHDPKLACSDAGKYVFSRLPDSSQRRVRTLLGREMPATSPGRPQDLVADISRRFYVPETFVRLFRQQDHGPIDWSGSSWEEFFEHLPPLQKITVPYAMSTVVRGRAALSLLESQTRIRQKDRYLDVGTGYGGFLRAAKEAGFQEVVGIELQQDLVDLARTNVAGLPGTQVLKEDFLSTDFSGTQGFDLITCNDVIEHVDDPHLAIQKMTGLVKKGGCLSFEVPNKDAIEFVRADGHFLIFGITQLLKDQAAEYHAAYTGTEKSVYYFEMGEMYELDWYLKELRDHGFSAFIADTHSIGEIEDVPRLVDSLKQANEQWQVETKPKLEAALAQRITHAVESYMRGLEQDFSNLNNAPSKIRFKNKYLRTFWTIIATRE